MTGHTVQELMYTVKNMRGKNISGKEEGVVVAGGFTLSPRITFYFKV